MRNTFAVALMLSATLGLAACDKESEDKTADITQRVAQSQEKMNESKEKVNGTAKEGTLIAPAATPKRE